MRVATGHADLRMAEDLHDYALIDALGEQERGRGMPSVVDTDAAGFRLLSTRRSTRPSSVIANRPPVGLAPYEVALMPGWPGGHALVELGGPVRFEGRDERRRERDSAPALVGLNLGEVEPAAGSLRARPGMACTAGWAVVAMMALGADTGIGAAVLPGEALKLPADGQCSGVQIDVLPPKTKGFTLAQPKCEGDTPAGAVSPRCDQPDDAQRLVKGQRFDFVVTGRGGHQRGWRRCA